MKPTTLLLAASLVANIAFVSVFYISRPADSSATGTQSAANASASDAKSASASRLAGAPGETAASAADPARDAALGQAFARFAEKMRAAQAAGAGDGKWWRNRSGNTSREQMAQARRELSDAMIAAFGDDLGIGGVDNGRLSFLTADKRDKLRSILGDYDELMAKYGSQGGIQLASDKEKIKLLTSERDRDIAALLTPDELADYQMHTSASANTLRNRYGDGIASEDEFKKLYALQKAYDEKFPQDAFNGRVTPEAMKARSDAALQLQADMRAAVGDDAYAALKRASDNDLKQVDALVARLNLAPDTTDRVAATRDTYAAESQRIMADTATPFPQRREQLQALATRAKTDLTSTLGAEAADAYAQRSQWMSMLQSGMGYSTTPTANSPGALSLSGGVGPSVYPVMPAGVGGPGGARQVINMVSGTSTSSAPSGGAMFFSPDGGSSGGTQTQVFSVSTTASGDPHGPANTVTTVVAPAPGTAPTTTTAPAQTAPTPKP